MTYAKTQHRPERKRFPILIALVAAVILSACATNTASGSKPSDVPQSAAQTAAKSASVSVEISHPESEVLVTVKGKDLAVVHDEAYKAFVGDLERIAKSREVRFSKFAVSVMETSGADRLYRIDYRIHVSAAGKAKPHRIVDMRGTVWKEAGKAKTKAQARAAETVAAWEPKMRKTYDIVGKESSSSGNADLYHVATMLYGTKKCP